MVKKFWRIGLIIIIIFLFFSNIPSYAQEKGVDLAVNPAIIELTATPGSQVSQKIRIWNNLSSPASLTVTVEKLNGSDIHGHVIPVKPKASDDFVSWVHFDNTSFVAPPKEWATVTATISIPKDAAFSYYYIFSFSQTGKLLPSSPETFLGGVAIPVLLEVKRPGAVKQAQLVSFKPLKAVYEYLPVDFSTIIQNTGNVHISPQGNIFIKGGSGKDIAVLTVNEEQGNVLPGYKREFISSWADGFLVNKQVVQNNIPQVDKNGNPKTHIVINWNKLTSFRFGKYTAHLIMVYDNGARDVTLDGTTSFWIIPYTLIFVVVISLIIIFIIFKLLLNVYVSKQIKKYKHH